MCLPRRNSAIFCGKQSLRMVCQAGDWLVWEQLAFSRKNARKISRKISRKIFWQIFVA